MHKKLFSSVSKEKRRRNGEVKTKVLTTLKENMDAMKQIVGGNSDVVLRHILIGHEVKGILVFISSLVDKQSIEENVVKPLLYFAHSEEQKKSDRDIEHMLREVITYSDVSVKYSLEEAIEELLAGKALLFIDEVDRIVVFETTQFEQRSIEEPGSEVVIRGPRDGFTETLQTNVALIRHRLRDPSLKVQFNKIGRRSKVDYALIYIENIACPQLVEEVKYRLACIDIDITLDTGILEQYIEDKVLTPFPQMMRTERPDKVVAALAEGKVAILLDGTPFVLLAPIIFHELLKSLEDNYDRWMISSMIRFLRYLASFIALFLPAIYIAMVSYHQGMIPTIFALSIAGTREGVPFPAFIEAFLMEMTLELLREAGVRMPRAIGQTIGIVGGLVIGDAAVRAGIVSPVMVIVVALTALSSFAIPAYNGSIAFRILRFSVMIVAAILGLFGIVMFFIFITIHLVGLRSFHRYYTYPFAPYHFSNWLDLVIRAPLTLLKKRQPEDQVSDVKKKDM
ncbi:spore germination protein [Halalkalibacterium halodurans]|uniref:spore germination protein n=1 Tax=Halalkalibacterium halodurans TaxID=86665 RepID=UPI002AAA1382|nr:spore germination protein [Halalkalibacterium halodurans]MDY7221830.1 spore germination protein [Halalkalibacterium halodurans]MDY7241106.1 spore germination protein [Halalkalibacterium halodurans]